MEEYKQLKQILKDKGITTTQIYKKLTKTDNRFPSDPKEYFKENWKGYDDYLDNPKLKSKEFLPYEESKKLILTYNFKTKRSYDVWIRDNKLPGVPFNPSKAYKYNGWVDWSDYLGSPIISNQQIRNNFLPFEDCKIYLRENNICDINDWNKLMEDKPDNIPSLPYVTYKDKWVDWYDFFGKERPIEHLSYEECKKYLKENYFILTQREFNEIKLNMPKFIPQNPYNSYNNEWISWNDFLGTKNQNESAGEIRIETYLKENNINYEKQKSLPDCKWKYPLKFDFYLTDTNTCIEYDGIQHYRHISKFGGIDAFEDSKIRDFIKDNYCRNNNIKLVRIKYDENISIDSILQGLIG